MTRRALLIFAFVVASTVRLAADPRDGDLLVIVHPATATALSAAMLETIFLRRQLRWDGGDRIIPINAPAEDERRRRFDRVVLGMSSEEVARYWLDLRIRGGGTAPREVADPGLTVRLVAKLTGAVGYVPADTALDGVQIVARLHNDKVLAP